MISKEITPKKNFDFVDTIRCISMIGIVMEHCAAVATNIYSKPLDIAVETGLIQIFKFSTIAFFLIGGFLINHKFQEYSAKQYLKNRVKNTLKPWFFWVCVFMALTLLDRYIAFKKGSDDAIATHFVEYLSNLSIRTLFFTSFWFIPNFLLCISILLVFKKYLYNIWFGALLAILSLFYSVNVYFGWIVTTHSAALLGFVFYLWLGAYMNKYYDKFMGWLLGVSYTKIIIGVVVLFFVACRESNYLNSIGVVDAYNTLRISNILYSLVVFLLLLKIGNIKFIQSKFRPRETTFGIYLLHFIIIDRVLPLIFQPMRLNIPSYGIWENTSYHLIRFLIVYPLSLGLTMLIAKTKMKWTVGR